MSANSKRKNGRPLEHNKPVRIVETGEVYDNYIKAADAIGGYRACVYLCLKGLRPRHMGYSFRYEDDVEKEE